MQGSRKPSMHFFRFKNPFQARNAPFFLIALLHRIGYNMDDSAKFCRRKRGKFMQLFHRLYQVSGSLNGVSWAGEYKSYADANSYALRTQAGVVLFDCGNGETWPQIAENLAYWGIAPSEICACLLTHAHLDHSGAAQILAEMGVPLYAQRETARAVAAGDERCAGYLYHKQYTPCPNVTALEDGDTLRFGKYEITLMHCPGHTAGCAAYLFTHEGKKMLVSGDIIGTLQDGYFGWDGSIDFDRAVYLQTLQKFARVKSDVMLPGHGMVYYHNPRQRVEEALCMALSSWR